MSIAYPCDKRQTQQSQQATTELHPAILAQHQQHPATVPYAVFEREQQRRKAAEEEARQANGFIRWEDDLFSNPHISGNHKLEIRATKRAVQRAQTKDEQGRARINLTTIAEQIGVSPDTMSRGLKVLEKCGVIADHDIKPEIQENGERWTRHYVSLNEELLSKPKEIKPPEPRNHGGQRYTCQKCGSDKVKIRKRVTLICKCCQHESLIEETERDQQPEQQIAAQENEKHFDEQGRNLRDILKPVTPPYGAGCADENPESQESQTEQILTEQQDAARYDDEDKADLQAAAELLLALAGQTDEHIEMSRTGAKKYYTVDRALTTNDLLDHLQGGQARGATCSRPDGLTRGLCWDADDPENWELLQQAARQLAQAGYSPILEPSPASRGGHLWVIYNDLVNAAAAKQHVQEIAPQLADIVEYWPGPQTAKKWNRVRLPGGRYVRHGRHVEQPVKAWCKLLAIATGEASQDGRSAAKLLLSNQTPAAIVPVVQNQDSQTEISILEDQVQNPVLTVRAGETRDLPNSSQDQEQKSNLRPGQVDDQWYQRYNTPQGSRLWFRWTPQQVAAWWNERHSLDEIHSRESNGMALSPNGEERTASTGYYMTPQGERWTDFSQHGRRPDGTHESGDAIELQARMSQTLKGETFRQASREMLAVARADLEAAARAGQLIPAWLEEYITDQGRAHYTKIASQAGYQVKTLTNSQIQHDQEQTSVSEPQVPTVVQQTSRREHKGGANGFLFPQESISVSNLETSEPSRQLREIGEAVPFSLSEREQLEAIRAYGIEHKWPALVIDGVEIISEGSRAWLDFVWLPREKDRQYQVFKYIQG